MYFSFLLLIGQKLTQVWRIKSVLIIYIFPLNLLSCVQKALKNIQTKFHWDRMKHKKFIEVSNICPTITLSTKYNALWFEQGQSLDTCHWGLLINSFNWGSFVKDLYQFSCFSFLVTYVPHPHLSSWSDMTESSIERKKENRTVWFCFHKRHIVTVD